MKKLKSKAEIISVTPDPESVHQNLLDILDREHQIRRTVRIKNLDQETRHDKQGEQYKAVSIQTQDTSKSSADWTTKVRPLWTDEGELIVRSGPYKENDQYEVISEKNSSGYWNWISIEKMDGAK